MHGVFVPAIFASLLAASAVLLSASGLPERVGLLVLAALFTVTAAHHGIVAWFSRLTITPDQVVIRNGWRTYRFGFDAVEGISVDHGYSFSHRRDPDNWRSAALHWKVTGRKRPLVAAATDRGALQITGVVAAVDAALGEHGLAVRADPVRDDVAHMFRHGAQSFAQVEGDEPTAVERRATLAELQRLAGTGMIPRDQVAARALQIRSATSRQVLVDATDPATKPIGLDAARTVIDAQVERSKERFGRLHKHLLVSAAAASLVMMAAFVVVGALLFTADDDAPRTDEVAAEATPDNAPAQDPTTEELPAIAPVVTGPLNGHTANRAVLTWLKALVDGDDATLAAVTCDPPPPAPAHPEALVPSRPQPGEDEFVVDVVGDPAEPGWRIQVVEHDGAVLVCSVATH